MHSRSRDDLNHTMDGKTNIKIRMKQAEDEAMREHHSEHNRSWTMEQTKNAHLNINKVTYRIEMCVFRCDHADAHFVQS